MRPIRKVVLSCMLFLSLDQIENITVQGIQTFPSRGSNIIELNQAIKHNYFEYSIPAHWKAETSDVGAKFRFEGKIVGQLWTASIKRGEYLPLYLPKDAADVMEKRELYDFHTRVRRIEYNLYPSAGDVHQYVEPKLDYQFIVDGNKFTYVYIMSFNKLYVGEQTAYEIAKSFKVNSKVLD